MDEIETYLRTCPACLHDQWLDECLLGTLGKTEHYRCRHCGGQWHSEEPIESGEEE